MVARTPKRIDKGLDTPSEIELRPDGWERFEKAVDVAARTPAKHRGAPLKGKKPIRTRAKRARAARPSGSET